MTSLAKKPGWRGNNFDAAGREYARVDDVKAGDTLEMDGGFSCMKLGARRVVRKVGGQLQVICGHGGHVLIGQISFDSTHYVGMYKVAAK